MSQQQEKKLTKSKKWIDYSSEEENEHHEEEKPKKQHHQTHHQKLESKPQTDTKTETHQNLPLLSTSQEPVTAHLLEDKKDLLDQLRQIRGNTVWIVLSTPDEKNSTYLSQRIQDLKKEKNQQILSIYPSRDEKKGFDLRIEYNLCQKWIVEGIDKKHLIKLQLRKKPQQKRENQKYEQKDRDSRPVRQYAPQHTTSTRYEPKRVQYKEKQTFKSPQRESENNYSKKSSNNYPEKKLSNNHPEKKSTFQFYAEYIEKNPLAEQIEQKVEQELQQRKLQKKEKTKKPQASKIFSKNPYDAFNDSD